MVFYHHKPLTGMYGDNYRYGTSLYSPSVGDVEKTYRNTLSKTHLRSDRGDLGMYTFAGSHLHGGTPANEPVSAPKSSRSVTNDLYAPLNAGDYGKGYYDHLRATSPPPRSRTRVRPELDEYGPGYYDHLRAASPEPRTRTRFHLPDDDLIATTEYKTVPARISTDYDGHKTTTKKTTVTEQWVPLTTHIYNTPYHTYYYRSTPHSSYTYRTADDLYSYNYVDDYKRYGTTSSTTRSKNIEALDLSVTSKNYEKTDISQYSDKCHHIQSQLDEVNKWVQDAETKLKSEVVSARDRIQTELGGVTLIVEDTARYNDELHGAIRKQAKQISKLSTQYEDVNRHLVDISETLEKSRVRCQSLQSDLSSVQSGLDLVMKRRI